MIVLPGDIAQEKMYDVHLAHAVQATCPSIRPCDHDLGRLTDLLNAATRVTILAGAGCAGAHDPLMQLADALKAPIVHALRGARSSSSTTTLTTSV